jgi:hypothetical protein
MARRKWSPEQCRTVKAEGRFETTFAGFSNGPQEIDHNDQSSQPSSGQRLA